LLDEFNGKPQVELIKFQEKFGVLPDLKDVLRRDRNMLVPASRVVQIQLTNRDVVDFNTFKSIVTGSGTRSL
jgi:hypothetical protein